MSLMSYLQPATRKRLLTVVSAFALFAVFAASVSAQSGQYTGGLDKPVEVQLPSGALRSAFSPNGKFLGASDDQKTLRIWNAETWAVVHDLVHSNSAYSPIFSPDSSIVVASTGAAANGGRIHEKIWFWDVNSGKQLAVVDRGEVDETISSMAFSPDGKTMAWGTSIGDVRLVDVQNPKQVKTIYEKNRLLDYNDIESMSFSPDGTFLAVASLGVPIIVLDVKTGMPVFNYRGIQNSYQVTFSPDGKTLAICGKLWKQDDRRVTVRLFSTDSWQRTEDLKNHDGSNGLRFTADGRSLVLVGQQKVELYGLTQQRVIKSINNKYTISAASINSLGTRVAFADLLGDTVKIYDL